MKIDRKNAIATLLLVFLIAASAAPIYQVYARRTHTITAFADPVDGGVIYPSGEEPVNTEVVQVNNRQDQELTIKPNSGYHINKLIIDGTEISVDIYDIITYTFTKVKADHTIVAVFEANAGVTFESGNAETEINVLSTAPSLLPSIDGVTPYFEIVITQGTFSGNIVVAVHYDDIEMSLDEEQNLRLYIGNPVDFDNNGTVNGNDIAAIQEAEKSEFNVLNNLPVELQKFDLNHDGIIDIFDVNIVKDYANSGLIVNPGQDDAGQFRIPWIDITTWVDDVNNIVYGETWHLSVFRIR